MSEYIQPYPPAYISESPEAVKDLMLREKPMRRSALVRLKANRLVPVDNRGVVPRLRDADTSFSRQMHDLVAVTREDRTVNPPRAYVFTEKSALPLMAAVKAYLLEMQSPAPVLETVRISRSAAKRISNQLYHTDLMSAIDAEPTSDLRDDVAHLSEAVGGLGHVCVVDQFVSSGNTLWISALVLREAGVQTISGLRGEWYVDAGDEALAGGFEDFFTQVGKQAAVSG